MPLLNTAGVRLGSSAATARHRGIALGGALPVTSGLAAHYDSSKITGLVEGAKVEQFDDLSGNERHLVQAVEGNKPVYRAAGAPSGLPLVEHSSDSALAHHLRVAFAAALPQPNTLLGVFRVLTVPARAEGGKFLLDGVSSTGRHAIYTSDAGGVLPRGHQAFAGTAITSSAPATDTLWHLHTIVFDGAASLYRIDQAQRASGNAGAQAMDGITTNLTFDLTAAGTLHGLVLAELVVYDRLLTVAERDAVEAHLNDKWLVAA